MHQYHHKMRLTLKNEVPRYENLTNSEMPNLTHHSKVALSNLASQSHVVRARPIYHVSVAVCVDLWRDETDLRHVTLTGLT